MMRTCTGSDMRLRTGATVLRLCNFETSNLPHGRASRVAQDTRSDFLADIRLYICTPLHSTPLLILSLDANQNQDYIYEGQILDSHILCGM